MQTYGNAWTTNVGSTIVYPYFPAVGISSDGKVVDVSNKHINEAKKRIRNIERGSGPFFHYRGTCQLRENPIADGGVYLITGSIFGSSSPLTRMDMVSRMGNYCISMALYKSTTTSCYFGMTQYESRFKNGRWTVATKDLSVRIGQKYSTFAYAESTLWSLYNQHAYRLSSISWRNTIDKHVDIMTKVINVDYTGLVVSQPDYTFVQNWERISVGLAPIGTAAIFTQRAYELAAADLPISDVNAIANTMESAGLLRAVISRDFLSLLPHGKSVSKAVASSWLAYRYAVSTTRLDVAEYKQIFRRLDGLSRHQYLKSRGVAVDPATGDIYRVTLKLKSASFASDDLTSRLERLGFQLNLVNTWDIIPYSFIIDWFSSINELLEVLDQKCSSAKLDVVEAWASRESSDNSTYIRWQTHWTPTFPLVTVKEVSNKTFFMRIADAISLATNR